MINQLPPSDDAFKSLSGSFFKHTFEGLIGEKNDRAKKIAILLAVVILAYAGVESVKLFFRNNFGKEGLNIWRLILSFGVFVTIGIIGLNYYLTFEEYESFTVGGTKDSFLYVTILYFAFALFLLVKGWIQIRKRTTNAVHPSYRGDSTVLSFLVESGWSQAKVQNFAEPLLFLAIGIFLSPINLLLGLPLVFCAISVWIHYAYEAIRGLLNARNELSDNKGFPENQGKTFSRVVN